MLKIAINLSREYLGGITSSNINLINYLYGFNYEFVGLELNSRMYMKGPVLFRNFSPELFDHHIVNIFHLPIMDVLKKSKNISDVQKFYSEPIKIIRKILRETKPDVVLLSGTYFIPWLISIAAKQEKIPIVLWYSGILFKETENQQKRYRDLFLAMEKGIVARVDDIIFPSALCKKIVEKKILSVNIKNNYVIPNPVAGIFTDPCATNFSIERRIAAVGRYTKVKNFDLFFDLHKELLKRKWKHNACFVTDPNAYTKKFPKTVEILPPMTAEGLKNFYISQGLIICPSNFETFGNVPMEAACLGIPVLVSEKMGCAEILKKAGLENMVISFENKNETIERIQQLCGHSILFKQRNILARLLDSRLISEEISAVINNAVKNSRKNDF